jgi:hypothetical protein
VSRVPTDEELKYWNPYDGGMEAIEALEKLKKAGPPMDLTAEEQVIGAVLLDATRLQHPDIASLHADEFADEAYSRTWRAMREQHAIGKPLDINLLVRTLAQQPGEVVGYPLLAKCVEKAGTGAAAPYFADIIRDKARLRRQWHFNRLLTEQISHGLPSEDVAGFIELHIEQERTRGEGGDFVLRSFREMSKNVKGMKPVVIDGLLRESEVANLVSVPKIGKSWMVGGLLLSVSTGRDWLQKHCTTAGNVLLIDNELHEETISDRIPRIAEAMGIGWEQYVDRLHVHCLRGRMLDINSLATLFNRIEPGKFKLVVLDALYRLLPDGSEENSNSDVKSLYNRIDQYAERMKSAFVCVHHSSKGSQSGKSTTDVGSGAGSQSRAADSHIVLREHEEPGAIVLDGNVRSFPPIEPFCLRWQFPVWHLAEDLNPLALKPDRPARPPKAADPEKEAKEKASQTTPKQFVEQFITAEPQTKAAIILAATDAGLTKARASQLFDIVTGNQKSGVHLWKGSDKRQKLFANREQPLLEELTQTTNAAA